MAPIGVVVAQLGGPTDLDEVEPFIRSILADPLLVPLPGGQRTRAVFSTAVAKLRAPLVRPRYRAIGGGSPIVETTRAQADALAAELATRGLEATVVVANRYCQPDTATAVDLLMAAGVDRLVLLPLFPQYSITTTGSAEAELRRCLTDRGVELPLTVISSWWEQPGYLEAQARLVDEILAELPDDRLDRARLIFSAHGLPQRTVDRGDPYPHQIEATAAAVTSRLRRPVDHVVAYQSRTGPLRWIGPDVADIVSRSAQEGLTWVGVVPIAFVSDHIETLHELDIELRAHATASGIDRFQRARCLGTDPSVGPLLADVVEAHLFETGGHPGPTHRR